MNKKIIPILMLLASSVSYAQDKIGTPIQLNDKGLPPMPKSTKYELPALTKAQIDFLKLPPLPVIPSKPNFFYAYTVNVEKITKGNPNPIYIHTSTGLGTEINTSYFYNYRDIPYVKQCIKEEGKEMKCSYDNLRTGFGYMINVFKPYDKVGYEVSIEINLSDLIKWRSFEDTKLELPETNMLHMKKTFAYSYPRGKNFEYVFKKKTVVFKSSEYAKSDLDQEYIFTVTIEPTYKKEIK